MAGPKEGGPENVEGSIFEDLKKLDKHLGNLTEQRAASKGIAYGQALAEISSENPALFKLREALYMKRERGNFKTETYEWIDGRLREVEQSLKDFVQQAMKEHPEMSLAEAQRIVVSEHRQLFNEREWLRSK